MAIFCSECGAQNPDTAAFCSKCGKSIPQPAGAAVSSSAAAPAGAAAASPNTVAGAIAYLTFIPALILLLIEPYNRDRFVRFHAWQCLWLTLSAIILRVVVWFLPGMFFLHLALRLTISCLLFVFWLIAIINAAQGKMYKIPVLGDLAEAQAGKV